MIKKKVHQLHECMVHVLIFLFILVLVTHVHTTDIQMVHVLEYSRRLKKQKKCTTRVLSKVPYELVRILNYIF